MDALLKALEARGYSAEISKEDSATRVHIGDERLKVRLVEKSARSERELTVAEEKKKREGGYIPDRYIYTPNGRLTFEIDEYCGPCRTKWADKDKRPLEEQLNEIVAGLVAAAEYERLRRIEREEERRRWQEAERRRMAEQERVNVLERHLEVWHKSRRVKEFAEAFERSLGDGQGGLMPDDPEALWLRWARDYADRLDPIKNGLFAAAIRRLD
ncbi:MAG TPA: hypothetical protein VIP46_16855 [Pyrinomonadaceae bacterium]